MIRASQAAFEGRFSQALALAERAHVIGRRGGNDAADFLALVLHSHVALLTGVGLDDVEPGVRAFVEHGPFLARGWLALLLVVMGRTDEASALWSSLVPHLDSFPRHATEWLVAASGGAQVCIALEDRDAAPVLYELLRPYADRWVNGQEHGPNEGPVTLSLGMLAILREDWPAAEAHLTSALASSRAMGSEPYEATARLHLARLLLARCGPGDARAADEHLAAASRVARRLGMASLEARVTSLRATRPALSSREQQVAALVAMGMSNRQIATRLELSERTAENHVANILTKLGFESRARIAAWYAARPPA
jgi:DNA-binding CsgD family transcriptional regulator